MLVEKKKPLPEIISVKLITGEEIIAKYVDLREGTLFISLPLSMVMAENPENPTQTRVMFTPWMVSAGVDDIEIREQHILTMTQSRKDAAEQYLNAIKD